MNYLWKYISLTLLLFLIGCSGYENDKIDIENIKENNPLIVPPCLEK